MLKKSKMAISAGILSAYTPVLIQSGSVAKASGVGECYARALDYFFGKMGINPYDPCHAYSLGILGGVILAFALRALVKEVKEVYKYSNEDYLKYKKICGEIEKIWKKHRLGIKKENTNEACKLFQKLNNDLDEYYLIINNGKLEYENIIEDINKTEERLIELEGRKDEDYGTEEVSNKIVPKGITHVGFHKEMVLYRKLHNQGCDMERKDLNLLKLLRKRYPKNSLFQYASATSLRLSS